MRSYAAAGILLARLHCIAYICTYILLGRVLKPLFADSDNEYRPGEGLKKLYAVNERHMRAAQFTRTYEITSFLCAPASYCRDKKKLRAEYQHIFVIYRNRH